MDDVRALAARNNAQWCDAVCATHGLTTRFDDDAWVSETRTPQFYPDAVTLVPDAAAPELLARIDTAPGCSIKDSFASLDLSAYGFRVLFDAEWIVREPRENEAPSAGPRWGGVGDARALMSWDAIGQGDDPPTGVYRFDLLRNRDIALLVAFEEERFVARAALNRSPGVVGLTNIWAEPSVADSCWSGLFAFADQLFPGATLVGYESGAELETALRHGFTSAGPLQVWVKD